MALEVWIQEAKAFMCNQIQEVEMSISSQIKALELLLNSQIDSEVFQLKKRQHIYEADQIQSTIWGDAANSVWTRVVGVLSEARLPPSNISREERKAIRHQEE